MSVVSPKVKLRPLQSNDEDAFMQGVSANRDLLKLWEQVPVSRKAFQKYVLEMNTVDDHAWAVMRQAMAQTIETALLKKRTFNCATMRDGQ